MTMCNNCVFKQMQMNLDLTTCHWSCQHAEIIQVIIFNQERSTTWGCRWCSSTTQPAGSFFNRLMMSSGLLPPAVCVSNLMNERKCGGWCWIAFQRIFTTQCVWQTLYLYMALAVKWRTVKERSRISASLLAAADAHPAWSHSIKSRSWIQAKTLLLYCV